MIDFRYHIVSLVAIFMALAVGIVLGSGPLKDDISGFLEDRTQQLADEKVSLQGEVSALRAEIESSEQFAELSQPVLVDGLLTSRVTTVVVLPDVDGEQVDAVEDVVQAAGGSVGERVVIESAWSDPEESEILGRMAEEIAQGGRDGDPYELASQVLAEALLTPSGRAAGEPSLDSVGVLAAFENEGFISADEDEVIRGDTTIVIGPAGAYPNADLAVMPLLAAFDELGEGTVLSAPLGSDQAEGVIGVLRGSDVDGVVSSEDRLDTVNGVTSTALALAEQIAGGVGHYGTGEGSDGPAPDPLPRG